jgi:Zn-dependent protease
MPSSQGSIRLVRMAGIDVFLHWSWFLVAAYEVSERRGRYHSVAWNAAEYLALFAIVTLHEFGHSLACRQVGGRADRIVLWPLGGVAYVDPPQRPGATLWSIAAGPLVNVALVPVLFGLAVAARSAGLAETAPDATAWLRAVAGINLLMLAFNLLPVYPLDGGQILRSLLWFVLGRARSLTAASVIGFLGVLALLGLALAVASPWLGILAVFVAMNCWQGFQHARALARLARLPRRAGFSCPSCRTAPPVGAFWACGRCQAPFDTFEAGPTCPACGEAFAGTLCVDCGRSSPIGEWQRPEPIR